MCLEHLAHAEAQPAGPGLIALDGLAERVGQGAKGPCLRGEPEDLADGERLARIQEERPADEGECRVRVRAPVLRDPGGLHQDRDLRLNVGGRREPVLGEVEDEAPVVRGDVRGEQHPHDVPA